jgi:hypothetical protein
MSMTLLSRPLVEVDELEGGGGGVRGDVAGEHVDHVAVLGEARTKRAIWVSGLSVCFGVSEAEAW